MEKKRSRFVKHTDATIVDVDDISQEEKCRCAEKKVKFEKVENAKKKKKHFSNFFLISYGNVERYSQMDYLGFFFFSRTKKKALALLSYYSNRKIYV